MSMKILVPVKRVVDPYVKIRVNPSHDGVETTHVKHAMNPFDEIAIEEALRMVEQGVAEEVTVVTIGQDISEEVLRHALALGAHKSILVHTDESHPPLHIAKILKAIVEKTAPDLILMGKQSIDGDNNQTPQMLAALLDFPQATFASKIEYQDGKLRVSREVDAGLQTITVSLPAVVSADLRLNEPRYASLPNIMKAKQKPLEKLPLTELNLELKPHTEVVAVTPPPTREAGIKVDSVEALVQKLRDEEKVI